MNTSQSHENAGPSGYTLWSVLQRPGAGIDTEGATGLLDEWEQAVTSVGADSVVLRGIYDVSAIKADSDVMLWLHGDRAEDLQAAWRRLRRTGILSQTIPVFNMLGVHRTAEFNARHVPAFLLGKEPREWLTIYPFVRSYEWYLLEEDERRAMLADHGRRGSKFTTVLSNTVASFALGDYEWILALEADELTDLTDLMRDLRYTEARRHVREEVPFYTGRRINAADLIEVLR